ncbi:MAG: 2-oxoacid:acceptor oxidoreductase family protein [Deltaproteobacteria bacterium]
MERELMLSGIGGQGVQLAGQVLACAAVHENRYVSMFALYEGMVRGGATQSILVFADSPIETPPIVSNTWSAIAMHEHHFSELAGKLRPEGFVLVNSDVFDSSPVCNGATVAEIPATSMAAGLGSPMCASMVMAAAYAKATGLVGLDSLIEAMKDALPAYRSQHMELNERALVAGFDSTGPTAPAWSS